MIKKKDISKVDIKIWNDFVKNPSNIFDKEISDVNQIQQNNRFKFDLHGYSLEEANKKVEELIRTCIKKKFKELLLITGKGIHSNTDQDVYVSKNLSKLRYSVPDYISSNSELSNLVTSISKSNKFDGGDGAILIKLKKL